MGPGSSLSNFDWRISGDDISNEEEWCERVYVGYERLRRRPRDNVAGRTDEWR